MNKQVNALLTLFILSIFALNASAAKKPKDDSPHKLGLDYFSTTVDFFDFRAIDKASTAHGVGSSLVMGTYLTDWIKTEGRIGKGLTEDAVSGSLKAGINYWASWYMGLIYPITDFSTAYIQAGFSYVDGKTTRDEDTVSSLPAGFVSSQFSISWLAGADLHITGHWYFTGELGRLHADTTTGIKTFMAGVGVKYEY